MTIELSTFRDKMAVLDVTFPQTRELSANEAKLRMKSYREALQDLEESDFVEACDRVLFTDQFFPTVSRLREVAEQCRWDRERRETARRLNQGRQLTGGTLTCPTCHGARWVRRGGASPVSAAGDDAISEMRIRPCPDCTWQGQYSPDREQQTMERVGGVPVPGTQRGPVVDMQAKLAPFRTADGRIDLDALYRYSRELRGLDPTIDARPQGVGTWQTFGEAAA